MVDRAATIADRTDTEAANVAAAAEQQTTAMARVKRGADEVFEQTDRLGEIADRFDAGGSVDVFPDEWERATPALPQESDDDDEIPALESAHADTPSGSPEASGAASSTAADRPDDDPRDGGAAADERDAGARDDESPTYDAYELKQAVIDAYPGDEPPWHALARIQLKTDYDLEAVEPGERIPADRYDEILAAAQEVTGREFTV